MAQRSYRRWVGPECAGKPRLSGGGSIDRAVQLPGAAARRRGPGMDLVSHEAAPLGVTGAHRSDCPNVAIAYRFDAIAGGYRVMYAAAAINGAFAETILHGKTESQIVLGLVSRIIGARHVGFGLKSPIHTANCGRVATHASLRESTSIAHQRRTIRRDLLEVADSRGESWSRRDSRFSAIGY